MIMKEENRRTRKKTLSTISNFHTVHTSHDAAPQDHSQPQTTHPQAEHHMQ